MRIEKVVEEKDVYCRDLMIVQMRFTSFDSQLLYFLLNYVQQ